MSNPDKNGPDGQGSDEPLSPEALAIMGKARRSFGISIGILLLGFMAIGFALVYRAMRDAPPPTIAAELVLPAGAQVISALLNAGEVNVTYRLDNTTTLALYDAETGTLTRSVVLTTP
jgi:hypothetical protein